MNTLPVYKAIREAASVVELEEISLKLFRVPMEMEEQRRIARRIERRVDEISKIKRSKDAPALPLAILACFGVAVKIVEVFYA